MKYSETFRETRHASEVSGERMENSRIRNSKRNIISGVIRQFLNIILAFIARTAVLYLLGEQYLGLGSLFTSILTVLNLAEMGFSVAVIYILYKPVAENNRDEICAILAYLRKVYWGVGCVILVAGLAVMPFLQNLISSDYPREINLYGLYLLYLMNTVVSFWFFAYKSALLTATQRNDIVNNAYAFSSIGVKSLQIILLLLFRNYYIFTAVLVVGTLVNNLLLQFFSQKLYPDLFPRGSIAPVLKQEMNRQVRSVFICRVGDVTRNSCDSIFISAFLGLTAIAIYDNYFYIFNAVFGVIWLISEALQASVGNSIVMETVDKNREDLYLFDFIFTWFIGWCSVCLCCLYQPFMRLWMNYNEQMLLSDGNVILLCLYFYCLALNNIRNLYINGAGLFVKLKRWYVLEMIANLVLNTVLGYFMGITGIILATLLSVLVCNFVARNNVLFKYYFETGLKEYYRNHVVYFLVTAAAGALTGFLCQTTSLGGVDGMLQDIAICVFVPNIVYLISYCRTDKFRGFMQLFIRVMGGRNKEDHFREKDWDAAARNAAQTAAAEGREKISVIVPTYNCAQWLPRCLDSLLNQTYQNMEIIVVNDGSVDNTREVLDDYTAQYPNLIAIHQKNAGEYAARLAGVAAATGRWIGFADADDETEPQMYANLMENALAHEADISHCGYKVIYPDGSVEYQQNTGLQKVQDTRTGVRDLLEEFIMEMGLCGKLFRKSLFEGLKEWMDFSIVINGDMLMNYYLFSRAEKAVLEDVCPYHYLIRQGSASRRKLNEHLIYDPIRVRQIILEQCEPELKADARRALVRLCLVSYRLIAMEDRKEYAQDRRKVRQLIKEQLPYCKILPLRNALLVKLISRTPWIFDLLYPPFERLFRK